MIDPESTSSLDKAVSAALSHARSERIGLRGWRSSRLHWEVSYQAWDSNLACYVVEITAQPLDQPDAPLAQWEYQLDEESRILPGFPVIQSLPAWDTGPGAAGPSDRGPRYSLGLLASVGALALISLLWLLTSPSLGLDASQLDPEATPTPVATPSPAPTTPPTITPTTTPVPTATPVPTLLPSPTPNPTPTSPAPTVQPTPTNAPTIVPSPSPTSVIPTATPRPTRPAPTAVPTPSLAPTVTPVPRHRLFINNIPVPGQQSLVFWAGASLTLSRAPEPDGRYANDIIVAIAVSPLPGTEAIWGGVDTQDGPFVIVEMNADRFITLEIRTPGSTP